MRGLCCAIGYIIGCDLLGAGSYVEHVDRAIEDGEGRKWLIEWNFMSRLVDASEREVAVLSCLAVLDAINRHRGVASFSELGCVCVIRREGDRLTTKPVANVIGITVDQGHSDGAVQDDLEIVDEIWIHEVTGLLEGPVNLVIRK